jgi:integrase
MSRKPSVPSYRLHKQSGQAVVTLPDELGGRQDVLLGQYDSPDSLAEYARVIAEWTANGRRLPHKETTPDLTVNELILPYFQFVQGYYRHPDGRPTSEVDNIRLALRPLRKLYGHKPAAEFDSLALEALREQMVRDGWCRNRINKDVARVKRLFRWGASKKLVPLSTYQILTTVEGLRAGRSDAKETDPVRPVAQNIVDATLPFLSAQLAAMVRLQFLTGMRPGEVTIMRTIDLETGSKVWAYRPGSDRGPHGTHKTAYRGQDRFILIGPRAQEVLRPWLRLNIQEYLCQPCEAMETLRARRRGERKTPMTPSQARRQPKRKPKRQPGTRYTVSGYAAAVSIACRRAFPHPTITGPDD